MRHHKHSKDGFALLMSLLVVSVVISVALTLIDLTIKQLKLSSVSRDSEVSFHAANAGVECARYLRSAQSADFEAGNQITANCFNTAVQTVSSVSITPLPPNVFKYTFSTTWTGVPRCSIVTMIIMAPPIIGLGVTLLSVPDHIPGYPIPDKYCPPGGRCTIISSQGYNQMCAEVAISTSFGVIQREVLLEL